jgi:chromosome segregation ATPase
MRRSFFFLTLVAFLMPAAAFCQAPAPDSQSLQALLTEVRELRRDLRTLLAGVQSGQILLARLQTEQAAVTRASDRLDSARSKLAQAQSRQRIVADNLKRVEDTLNNEPTLNQQKSLQDRLSHAKSDLDVAADEEQQSQAAVIEAERQLRSEQDKLNALEIQLDEVVKNIGSTEPSGHVRH